MKKLLFIPLACLLMVTTGCPKGSKSLATASDAISHGLADAQQAEEQGVTAGVVSPEADSTFKSDLAKVANAGLVLDNAIRANEAATTLSPKVNSFLDAFNTLDNQGLFGIKDPAVRLAISTALNGAEASIAIIAATVGK